MRIVTWNCQMGLEKKADALLSLRPDIAVVPECSEKSAVAFRQYGFETLWFGVNPHKGLGVICRSDWTMHALAVPEEKWVAPVEVNAPKPFNLIAVWACRIGLNKADNYIGQVYHALISHPEWFDGKPVILAGDLNSNRIWDAERLVGNHSAVVKVLKEFGLVSVYHEFSGEPQGTEFRPTSYLYRHKDKPFHIDYIFIPRQWATRLTKVDIGDFEKWTKLSDHCPLVAEVADDRNDVG